MCNLTLGILENEFWWGGAVNHGYEMPFHRDSCIFLDLRGEREGDQYAPLFLSSCGRYIWSEKAFTLRMENGSIRCEGEAAILPEKGFSSLKGAYLAAMRTHFPFVKQVPDRRFFDRPQYNTWIELGKEQTTENILRYARDVLENRLQPGILMIDEGWAEDYGSFTFNTRRIPDPAALISRLHEMGFLVMLWVTPVVSCAGDRFLQLKRSGWLIRDASGVPACREWWNGFSAVLDLTNPEAAAWYHEQLDGLMRDYGIDGFKFDAGDCYFYRDDDLTFRRVAAREQTSLYNRIGESYPLNEFRAAWKYGGRPVVTRLQDKKHSWDTFGINTLIPNTVLQGLLGYAYGCPDMVGGGEIGSFAGRKELDEELFVRWAQASALMGMMQVSAAPWRVLSPKNAALVRKAMRLHTRLGDLIFRLAKHAMETGEPIVRPMAYEFPEEGMEQAAGQFMLGSGLLAAPVTEKGAVTKTVQLPKGRWIAWNGTAYEGGRTITVNTTLSDIPYLIREEA